MMHCVETLREAYHASILEDCGHRGVQRCHECPRLDCGDNQSPQKLLQIEVGRCDVYRDQIKSLSERLSKVEKAHAEVDRAFWQVVGHILPMDEKPSKNLQEVVHCAIDAFEKVTDKSDKATHLLTGYIESNKRLTEQCHSLSVQLAEESSLTGRLQTEVDAMRAFKETMLDGLRALGVYVTVDDEGRIKTINRRFAGPLTKDYGDKCPLPKVGEWAWKRERAEAGEYTLYLMGPMWDCKHFDWSVDVGECQVGAGITRTRKGAMRAAERAARRAWRVRNGGK